jgi:sortase A
VRFVCDTRQQTSSRFPRFLMITEAFAWVVGIVLLADYGAWYIEGATGNQQAMQQFARLQAASQERAGTVDVTLWSRERIDAWRSTLNLPSPAPLAVLRIPRIRLEVPVLEGTDEVALNRALGHIEGTATPGMDGNAGIAGHRDGFFRGLKDIAVGDDIELETLQAKEIYRVERIWIVDPEDVSVLDPTASPSLTLVTCYPLYFIGPAPKRFIVRAARADDAAARRDR